MTASTSLVSAATDSPQPWWRYRFVWFVVALPASAVVAASTSGFIAIRGADKVVPEYTAAAKQAAEESLSREEQARQPAELARNHAATPRR